MKRFEITYEICEVLDVDAIWPDGDAPESPTADDVYALLRNGSVIANLREWNLDDEGNLHVREVS